MRYEFIGQEFPAIPEDSRENHPPGTGYWRTISVETGQPPIPPEFVYVEPADQQHPAMTQGLEMQPESLFPQQRDFGFPDTLGRACIVNELVGSIR